jgi:hypothetical protein
VVLVHGLRLRVAHADKVVVAGEPGEQLAGSFVAGELARHGGGHLGQIGGVQQELLRARIGLLEDLAGEVVEYQLPARKAWRLGDRTRNLGLLEHQDQSGRPALRAVIERVDGLGRRAGPPFGDDRACLFARETQLVPADHREGLVRAQTSERRGRVAAAHDEHATLGRQRLERNAQDLVQLRRRRHRLVAVEHHGERHLELSIQALEITPREHAEAGLIFRREQGQALALERSGGEAEVVEERGDIGVALVELIPERRDAGMVEPARGKRGLAAPGRASHPGYRAVLGKQAEEALARQHAGDARPRRLSQRYVLRLHFIRPRTIVSTW